MKKFKFPSITVFDIHSSIMRALSFYSFEIWIEFDQSADEIGIIRDVTSWNPVTMSYVSIFSIGAEICQ